MLRALGALAGWLSGQASQAAGGVWASLAAESTRELDLLALLKREVRVSRALWSAHFDLLSQLDELTQVTPATPEPRHPRHTRHGITARHGIPRATALPRYDITRARAPGVPCARAERVDDGVG